MEWVERKPCNNNENNTQQTNYESQWSNVKAKKKKHKKERNGITRHCRRSHFWRRNGKYTVSLPWVVKIILQVSRILFGHRRNLNFCLKIATKRDEVQGKTRRLMIFYCKGWKMFEDVEFWYLQCWEVQTSSLKVNMWTTGKVTCKMLKKKIDRHHIMSLNQI